MTNLFNLGRRGLTAAQMGLNITGHNITNVNTPGFSRQQVLTATTNAQGFTNGYVGTGVEVTTVRRIYDDFLVGQYNKTTASQASLATHADQLSRINNLLADRTAGVAPALLSFFDGVNAVASQPAEPAARQEMIGRANSLVTQLNVTQQFLQEQYEGVNQQIQNTVATVNSYAARINDLNDQIVKARATVLGQPPNDLLDQRDQLVNELNSVVAVNVIQQGDRFNITIGNGQTLIAGTEVYELAAVRSAEDPTRISVAYTTASGAKVEIDDQVIQGGSLGGLMEYRSDVLNKATNQLGQLAMGLAMAFNEQHQQGAGLDGQAGRDFFSVGQMPAPAMSNDRNVSSAVISYSISDVSAVQDTDYTISFSNAEGYKVTRHSDGAVFTPTPDPSVIDGFTVDGVVFEEPSVAPASGDTFLVQPLRYAARDIKVVVTNPAHIAASSYDPADPTVGGSADGKNALMLASLQTTKILNGGTTNLTESFSQMVNHIGIQANTVNTALAAQTSLKEQAFQAQQAVSGVNLNEEYINLDFYAQQYNASARLIDVGNSLFDTLLSLGR